MVLTDNQGEALHPASRPSFPYFPAGFADGSVIAGERDGVD